MKKKVFNLIIVDESGSMSCIEKQALAGMNETLSTIAKMDKMHENMEQLTTLITFDSTHRNFIFDNVPAGKLRQMTAKDYRPCGGTTLRRHRHRHCKSQRTDFGRRQRARDDHHRR